MTLTVERTSPTTLTVTRRFAAPPERVFAAHVEPALLRRWCYGLRGLDHVRMRDRAAAPAATMRYAWTKDGGRLLAHRHLRGGRAAGAGPRGPASSTSSGCTCPTPRPRTRSTTTFAPDGTARS